MIQANLNTSVMPWWAVLLRGIAGLLFGLAAVFWPGLTVYVLAFLFGAYLLVNGIVNMIGSLQNHNSQGLWWLTLILGTLELGVGIYLIQNPNMAFATFVLILGFTLMARGVLELVPVFDRQMDSALKTMLIIGGILSMLAGAIILLYPVQGSLVFVWVLGLYAILAGIVRIALSFDLKSHSEEVIVE